MCLLPQKYVTLLWTQSGGETHPHTSHCTHTHIHITLYTHTHTHILSFLRFFFWNDASALYRAPLGSVKTNSLNCPTSLTDMQTILQSPVRFFVLELTELYVIRDVSCLTQFQSCVSSINSNGDNIQNFFGIPEPSFISVFNGQALFDGFFSQLSQPQQLFVTLEVLDTPIVNPDLVTPAGGTLTIPFNLTLTRLYRELLQPLPGGCGQGRGQGCKHDCVISL